MPEPRVAEKEAPLPGDVLSPNSPPPASVQGANPLEQFGTEVTNPNPNAAPKPEPSADQGRFEYWQSVASRKDAELAQAKAELEKRKLYDPLVDLIRSDDETLRIVQSRLTAPRTAPPERLEPPQKPDNFVETEAYTNPDSASWKYRKALEEFKDKLILSTKQQNELLLQERERERAMLQQQEAQRQSMAKFKQDVVAKGIADQEFTEFFQFVTNATPDEMVSFYRWKKDQATRPQVPRFEQHLPSSPSPSVQPDLTKRALETGNVGDLFVQESRGML